MLGNTRVKAPVYISLSKFCQSTLKGFPPRVFEAKFLSFQEITVANTRGVTGSHDVD